MTIIKNKKQQNIIYNFFLFIKCGLCVLEKNLERNNEILNNENDYQTLKGIIKNIVVKIMNNNKNKNKEDIFLYNSIIINRYKIKIIIKAKIALVGIFSINTSKGFQNLLLMHLYISLINFKGDSIIKLNLINNYLNNSKNFKYNSIQEFLEDKNDEIINNKILNINKIDFLEISIFDKYFLKSCILHFEKVFNILTKKEDINLTFTKFLDLYIIDISSDILLLDLNEITNKYMLNNNTYYKYYKNKNIFKEILFHSHQLFNSYISKYGTKFIKDDSSQRFIKFECTSTYPRILFIVKFIPVLKGLIIVHIYYQSKLSRTNNNMNNENKYKEVDLVFGSFLGENSEMDLKYVMPKKLENIEKFAEEFFVTTRNNDLFKLNEPSKEFKYFNYNIIKIINSIPIDSVTPFQKFFEYINERIKEKYKEEKEKNNKKFIKIFLNSKKNISELNEDKNNESNINNTLTIKKEKNNNESNDSLDKIFLIDKNILYDDLFPNQSIKFSTIHPNFSTIKSNNKNIINILRESDSSIENNINFNKQKINDIKEEEENTKTLNLMTESNLISREDENINKEISKDFSLISSISKNDNNNLFKLKFYKNENTNLKNLNLQDLLTDTSNITNTNNIKEKIKHTEESVSDLINKEYNSNSNSNIITIKKKNLKAKRGKQRNKLVLMNDDI